MKRVQYEPGMILWRSVNEPFSANCALAAVTPLPVKSEVSDTLSYMLRVLDTGQWCPEPEVFSGGTRAGIAAFFHQQPHADWTHAFVSRSTSRAIHIVFGDPWSDYKEWRSAYAYRMQHVDTEDHETVLKIAREMDPAPFIASERPFKRVASSRVSSVVLLSVSRPVL